MNKKRIINLFVIALIVINIIALSYTFLRKEVKHNEMQTPRQFIIKKLVFDQQQESLYLELIDKHRSKMAEYRRAMEFAKESLYKNLAEESASKDSLLMAINKIQYQIDLQHYEHFQEIRKLCRPDQLDNFKELSKELSKLFGPSPPPHAGGPEKRNP